MGKEIRQALGNNTQPRLTGPPVHAKLRGQILPAGGINCRELLWSGAQKPLSLLSFCNGTPLADLTGM
jgi:hypothetical protein